jgi:hypothetical protein
MPGLSRDLVEHRLPIKAGFIPFKQHARHYNPIMYDRIKEEIDRLLKANFIRPCRYAEWISNIVPVEKKGSTFEKMRQYGLKMNPVKCAFGVSTGKFLGFIIHEHGIEIDPERIESIEKVKDPTCKKELQSLLGKINYLRWFISNLLGRVKAFTPILRLKNDAEFI